jgi:hypothetical protein
MHFKNRYISSALCNSGDQYTLNKQDDKCNIKVTLRRVHITIFVVQWVLIIMSVFYSLSYSACEAHAPYCPRVRKCKESCRAKRKGFMLSMTTLPSIMILYLWTVLVLCVGTSYLVGLWISAAISNTFHSHKAGSTTAKRARLTGKGSRSTAVLSH